MIVHRRLLPCIRLWHPHRPIIATNGCFDMLHGGHVEFLRHAYRLGGADGILLVFLNSDVSVTALKGEDRPILGEEHRMHVLDALHVVNYVCLFQSEEELSENYEWLAPDYLVKGEEYRGRKITGSPFARHVVYLPHCSPISTTEIIKRIREKDISHAV